MRNQAEQSGSAYDYTNWLLSGTPDMLQGAFNPDEPLSFDHWMNSLGTATLVYGGYKGAQGVKGSASSQYRTPSTTAIWDTWDNYEKVTMNSRTYARVGDALYSRHAVDRMHPSGFGTRFGVPNVQGRSIAPNYASYVVDTSSPVYQIRTGNFFYTSGNIQVVTNRYGMVVTVEYVKIG